MMISKVVPLALLLAALTPLSAQMATSHSPTLATKKKSAFATTGAPVARVNGAVLTDSDLLVEMLNIFPYAKLHKGFPENMEPQIRKGALEMIIFEELVYQEAQRVKFVVPQARLRKARADFRAQFSTSDEFQKYLKAEDKGSEAVLNKKIDRVQIIAGYLKANVKDKAVVTEAAARAFYVKNPARFTFPESFTFQSISFFPPKKAGPEAEQEAKRNAEKALPQAKATHSYNEFGLLAEKISEDDFHVNMGDHKSVDRDKLPEPFVKAALAMKPGQVSDVLQLERTYTIFRLNAHTPAGKKTFAEVKAQLLEEMRKDKEDKIRVALGNRLRKGAKIEIL